MKGGLPWLVVSSAPVAEFEPARRPGTTGEPHVYSAGWPEEDGLVFDVDTATPCRDESRPGTVVRVAPGEVSARISAQSRSPVYLAVDDRSGHVVLGTDLPTTAAAYGRIRGAEPQVVDYPVGPASGTRSAVRGVLRLAPGSAVRVRSRRDGWVVETGDELLPESPTVDLHDPLTAGRAQVDALRSALRTEQENHPSPVGVLVSGGVDSGLVAAILLESGAEVDTFTIGTPWGDEFAEAALLAGPLGLRLTEVHLDEHELTAALAAVVRLLGHTDQESVAIGLAPAAFLAADLATLGSTIFTGYGSDLVNSGMATSADVSGDIYAKVLAAVERARYTNELSCLIALGCGLRMVHPYWSDAVLDVALRTAPEAKRACGREKGHLRLAAAEILPTEVAWQRKTAIHQGNGLHTGLGRLVDVDVGRPGSTPDVLRALLALQVRAAMEDPTGQTGGRDLYEAAVAGIDNRGDPGQSRPD